MTSSSRENSPENTSFGACISTKILWVEPGLMLPDTAVQIAGHTDIHRSGVIGHDTDVHCFHARFACVRLTARIQVRPNIDGDRFA